MSFRKWALRLLHSVLPHTWRPHPVALFLSETLYFELCECGAVRPAADVDRKDELNS